MIGAVVAGSGLIGAATVAVPGPATAIQPAKRVTPIAVLGSRPFSASSPWNTPTPGTTQWYDTSVLHQHAGGPMHWWVGTGNAIVWYGKPTDPVWTLQLPSYVDPGMNRNRPAQSFQVHAPANLSDGGDVDHVLVIVDGANYYEVWQTQVTPSTRRVTGVAWATGNIISGPGAGTIGNNDGVRASNFSWAGGLITGSDLTAGRIDHALALSLPAPLLKSTPNSQVAPATAWDNGQGYGPIRMGSRIGVPAGVPKPAGLSPVGSMVFDALQKYGAFVGDYVGGDWPMFYADQNTVTDPQVTPLYEFWNHGGSADMEKIGPLLRVANYQP